MATEEQSGDVTSSGHVETGEARQLTKSPVNGAGSHSVFDDDEDNNPFSNIQGLASLMSEHGVSQVIEKDKGTSSTGGNKDNENKPMVDDDDDDDEASILLYNSSSNNNVVNGINKDTFNSIQINYESRVTKLLKPTSNVKIQITEAGNSNEGMANSLKKYIVYTIKLINVEDPKDEIQTRRRYSDFESLRDVLTKIFPLVIIPPIPPKNFFNLGMLNGLVGTNILSSNGTNGSTVNNNANKANTTANGTNSHLSSTSNYSYINSKHLTKNKLIEHRKRLLSNFLNNCLKIPQIRNLEFFAKFLDPNANWSDEIALITSQLPKSVYLLNPENGLKTDAVYSYLPNPVSNHAINMSFLKPLLENKKKLSKKTSKLISNGTAKLTNTEEQSSGSNSENNTNDLSAQTSPTNASEPGAETTSVVGDNYIVSTSKLDDINRKIMANFVGLSSDYTELGTALNSFSLILADSPIARNNKSKNEEDDTRINLIFDKVGQVFDRSYVTINSLTSDLETKFSEPLGEAVQYTEILQFINKFQQRKIRQQNLLDEEVKEKKRDLYELLKTEEESSRIEGVLNSQPIANDPKFDLNKVQAEETILPQSQKSSKFKLFPSMNSLKKITQYVSDIIDQNPELTRKQKITSLKSKITTLEKCQKIMLEDISYIADEMDKNFRYFQINELRVIFEILLTYNGFLIGWAKKNVDIWEEIKDEVEKL